MKRKIAIVVLFIMVTTMQSTAFATRRRQEIPESDNNSNETVVEKDYGDMYFFEMPSTGEDESLFDSFRINGKKIVRPDLTKYTDFPKEKISGFSDALVDYLGWDSAIGEMNLDIKDNKTTITKLDDGPVVGYSKRKFGDEDISFKIKTDGTKDAWFGVAIRCDATQKLQWNGNTGYLIIIKNDVV